jgi:hypothetical protein
MHSTKQSRRSIARPNLTKPSHLGVECGVAVERTQGFSLILPSGFVAVLTPDFRFLDSFFQY